MSKINDEDLKLYESNDNFIKYDNRKALFNTKIASSIRHNEEIVDVLGVLKGRDEEHNAYIVRFNDDTIEDNIMNIELKFDYIRDKAQEETRRTLSKMMKQYDLSDKEAEELMNATLNYDYEVNDGTVFTTVESIERLFTEEDSQERINPTAKQLKAMANYIKNTEEYYMPFGYGDYTEKVINLILSRDDNDITRLEILNEIKEMTNHNIMSYSKDYTFGEAKPGFENEFARENKKLILIEEMIREAKEKNTEKEDKQIVENKVKFYTEDEIKEIIKSKAELYFIDDGIDEAIIKFEDIPDAIVNINMQNGMRDLTFYKTDNLINGPDIKTMGIYLDKINPDLRARIIDRLVQLQTGKIEPKEYKLIDENLYNDIKIKMEQENKQKKKSKRKEAR